MLKIEHLKKSYENFSLDCSLEVKKGLVTGLIGQNVLRYKLKVISTT